MTRTLFSSALSFPPPGGPGGGGTLLFDGSNASGRQVVYNTGTPVSSGNTNQYAQTSGWPWLTIETGLGVSGSATPLNVGGAANGFSGPDPRIITVPAVGLSGYMYQLRAYNGDHGAGAPAPNNIGNLNPVGGSHFGSPATLQTPALVTTTTNRDVYISFYVRLPGVNDPYGAKPFPTDQPTLLIIEVYGPPFTGSPPYGFVVRPSGGNVHFAIPQGLSPFFIWWKSPDLTMDSNYKVVIHHVHDTVAGYPTRGYLELWFGSGGTTFAQNLVQQTFTAGGGITTSNSGKALNLVTAAAANNGGANYVYFSNYRSPFMSAGGTTTNPVSLYVGQCRVGPTYASVTS